MLEGGEIELFDEYEEYCFLLLEKESLNVMDIVFFLCMECWDFEVIKGFMRK